MRTFKTLLILTLSGGLVAPVLADELNDLYRGYKSSGEQAPQWLIDELFPQVDTPADRCHGGDRTDDAGVIPFVPCGVYTDQGSTADMTNDYDWATAPAACATSFYSASFDGPDMVYAFTLPGWFTVSASTCDAASYDTCLGIMDAAGNLVAVNDDGTDCGSWTSLLPACCLPPGDYFVIVDSYSNASGSFTLTVEFGCEPCEVVDPCDELLTTDITLPYHGTGSTIDQPDVYGSIAGDVAYRFTLSEDSYLELATCFDGTDYDTDSYWFANASPCDGGTYLGYNDGEYACGWATHVIFDCEAPLPAGTYVVLLSGFASSQGSFELDIHAESCEVVEADEQPLAFSLAQNAPNPFNPGTTIAFTMSATGAATLTVYDLAGRTVATLVDGLVEAGEHRVTYDASSLSSGVYLYTLQANGASETRKMILMK